MNAIRTATLYLIFYFVTDITATSVWKTIFSPEKPPLRKVRSLKEMAKADDHVVLDFIGLVQQYSYPAEEHHVTTKDGYRLTFHRIPSSPFAKNTNKKRKKVVYIQHGLLSSSDNWVLMGPGKDLPFLLADAGYDVWLGNFRGNTYCRSHVNLTTSERKFWDFSFQEHGIYDLPAMIDYVLQHTKVKKLYYIGHSMGTTSSYILLSMRPEYNKKFNIVVSLSPVAYWHRGVSPSMKILLANTLTLKKFFDSNEIFDIAPQSVTYASIAEAFCKDSSVTQPMCTTIMFSLFGSDPSQLNTTLLPYIFSYTPCGSSTQTFYHYYQNYATGKFAAYDYGNAENYIRYKKEIPPVYNLSKITAPFALYYAVNDAIMPPENVLEVAKDLRNVKVVEEVPHKQFTHIDFMWARDAKKLLYDRLIEIMRHFL